jgi:hypothetical protein
MHVANQNKSRKVSYATESAFIHGKKLEKSADDKKSSENVNLCKSRSGSKGNDNFFVFYE